MQPQKLVPGSNPQNLDTVFLSNLANFYESLKRNNRGDPLANKIGMSRLNPSPAPMQNLKVSIICQGVSGRRPSFLAIHAKLAKINTSTFWGFEPGTNFCKKFEPGTNFLRLKSLRSSHPPLHLLHKWPFYLYTVE